MNPPRVEQVIIAYERRGNGTSSPIRLVRQIFTFEGVLLGEEKDPYTEEVKP